MSFYKRLSSTLAAMAILALALIATPALAADPPTTAPAATTPATPLATEEIFLVITLKDYFPLIPTDKFVMLGDKQVTVYERHDHLLIFPNKVNKNYIIATRRVVGRYDDAPVRSDSDRLKAVPKVNVAEMAIIGLAEAKRAAEVSEEKTIFFEGNFHKVTGWNLKLTWHPFGGCEKQVAKEAKKGGFALNPKDIAALTIKK
ncbi:MAG: hypothetical protein K9L85_03630 [Candidatus Peribacteraceae bacterium]|nr:hypothetical protein [Candidatus Peribacteraceae bacterium]